MPDRISTTLLPSDQTVRVRTLEQALGVLMDWYELPLLEAKTLLATWAVRCDASACQVAEALVYGICLGRATTCSRTLLRQVEALLRQLPPPGL
jgi:hypothetical protein